MELGETMEFKVDGKPVDVCADGGYPLYYITADRCALCPECVNKNLELCSDSNDEQWYVTHREINWESFGLYCENCSNGIDSAYGD